MGNSCAFGMEKANLSFLSAFDTTVHFVSHGDLRDLCLMSRFQADHKYCQVLS